MNVRFLKKALDDKFKEIDNFITKKVVKRLTGYQQETSDRLDGIERSTYDTRDTIKRENMLKFTKMNEDMQNKNTESKDAMKEHTEQFSK